MPLEPSLAQASPTVHGEAPPVDAHPLDIAMARHAAGLRVAPSVAGDMKQPAYFDVDYRVIKLKRWEWLKERPATTEDLESGHIC